MLTAGVAIDKATLNFDREFSYIVPPQFAAEICVGSAVLVPFGRGNTLRQGIVLSLQETDNVKCLKKIIDVKTQQWSVTPFALKLVEYIKETTFCTYYDAAKAVIPYGSQYKISAGKLEIKHSPTTERYYTAAADASVQKLTEKQQKVYNYLQNNHKTIKQICDDCSVTKAVVDKLVEKQLLSCEDREKPPYDDAVPKKAADIRLNSQQQKAFEKICAINDGKPHLLYGVTSSGKTVVFIKLIQKTLQSGKSAMLLVPEISLTPQIIATMQQHFGNTVSVIHSKLTRQQRLWHYNRVMQGKSRVIVGTRSAVFAPCENIGMIIIDEEHEKTFKSENSPRYSAVRVAAFIAREKGAKLVLASATPSIESYYLAKNGYYHLHKMDKRYNDMPLPHVEVVDMIMQARMGDTGVLSAPVIKYISDNIKDKKQSIILINRRGYSTVGICKQCRQTLQCDSCSVNLVKHKNENRLSCHYCSKSYPIVDKCPKCGGEIQYVGYGTQRVEEYLSQCIPTARILRMDADTTAKQGAHEKMLNDFANHKYDVLVGTQMVAKGLDFKDVNLVCVLGIDGALNQESYNSGENAFSLLTQVIGRAGRWTQDALAVVQTYDGFNPIIEMAEKGDYESFYNREIAFRRMNIYPPFCTMCQVAFTGKNQQQTAKDSAAFLRLIRQNAQKLAGEPLVVLGPVPFSVHMVNDIYRYRLTLKCKNTRNFRNFLRLIIDEYLKNSDNKSEIYVNMNPISE